MSDEILMAGLGTVGTSIALALRHAKLAVGLVGYDADSKIAHASLKARVVDRVIGNLRDSPSESDLCILSLPPVEMIPALEQLIPKLGNGTLVLGVGPVQLPILAWCKDHLPAGRAYVGAILVEGALAFDTDIDPDPQHDRFSGGVMGLVLPSGAPQSGIDVAASLAGILGAHTFFLDPAELDAACAVSDGLPLLLAAALMTMSTAQPGWRDARRLTGRTLKGATALLADVDPKPVGRSLALSGPTLVAKLDALISELSEWRTLLVSGDEETAARRMSDACQARATWLAARHAGDWELEETRVTPPVQGPGILERMFGTGMQRGRKGRG